MSGKTISSEVTNVEVMGSNCDCGGCPSQQPCVDIDSTDLNSCQNTAIRPEGRRDGVVAKVPVVLAQLRVRANVHSQITLPEPAIEVKRIKKRLKITQCLILPAPDGPAGQDVLFIEGFIRKNIEYATRSCSNAEGVCGDIRHCTVDAPFRCSTPITNYCRRPQGPALRQDSEFEYLREETLPRDNFAEKDRLMSGDFSEFNQFTSEPFNELPFCELISAQITEFDEFINRRRPAGVTLPFEEREFRVIEEKMVIAITLKVLQKQQVVIPSSNQQPCPAIGGVHTSIEPLAEDNEENTIETCDK